jgi:hypothetical protein
MWLPGGIVREQRKPLPARFIDALGRQVHERVQEREQAQLADLRKGQQIRRQAQSKRVVSLQPKAGQAEDESPQESMPVVIRRREVGERCEFRAAMDMRTVTDSQVLECRRRQLSVEPAERIGQQQTEDEPAMRRAPSAFNDQSIDRRMDACRT